MKNASLYLYKVPYITNMYILEFLYAGKKRIFLSYSHNDLEIENVMSPKLAEDIRKEANKAISGTSACKVKTMIEDAIREFNEEADQESQVDCEVLFDADVPAGSDFRRWICDGLSGADCVVMLVTKAYKDKLWTTIERYEVVEALRKKLLLI